MDAIARTSADAGPAATAPCWRRQAEKNYLASKASRTHDFNLMRQRTCVLATPMVGRQSIARIRVAGIYLLYLGTSLATRQLWWRSQSSPDYCVVLSRLLAGARRRVVRDAVASVTTRLPNPCGQPGQPAANLLLTQTRCDASFPTDQIHVARSVLFPPEVVVARHRIQY